MNGDTDTDDTTDGQTTDLADMDVSQVGFNSYLVTNGAGDENTGYLVDLSGPDCQCKDQQMRDDGAHVCKHIMKANLVAETIKSPESEALRRTSEEVRALREATQSLEQTATAQRATDEAAASSADAGGSDGKQPSPDDDPVAALEDWFGAQGVDTAHLDIYEHDQYDSVQIETDGQLSDDEFDRFRELTDADHFNWDRNEGRNYIREDDVERVVG